MMPKDGFVLSLLNLLYQNTAPFVEGLSTGECYTRVAKPMISWSGLHTDACTVWCLCSISCTKRPINGVTEHCLSTTKLDPAPPDFARLCQIQPSYHQTILSCLIFVNKAIRWRLRPKTARSKWQNGCTATIPQQVWKLSHRFTAGS